MHLQLEREVDEFRKKLQSLKTEKQNQLLVSTSVVQDQQAELEKIQSSVKGQEEEKLSKEEKKKDISRELSQTTQAIRNLFGRCFTTMRIKPVFAGHKDATSLMEVLDYELDIILLRITDLVEISNEYKFSLENNNSASLGDLKENSTTSLQTASKSQF
jgi:hypothetical protein